MSDARLYPAGDPPGTDPNGPAAPAISPPRRKTGQATLLGEVLERVRAIDERTNSFGDEMRDRMGKVEGSVTALRRELGGDDGRPLLVEQVATLEGDLEADRSRRWWQTLLPPVIGAVAGWITAHLTLLSSTTPPVH